MKRGKIYYIEPTQSTGSEIRSTNARPGVIVSSGAMNTHSGVVQVCYLTTSAKRDMPCHTITEATGRESTVLCEQIFTVAAERVGDFAGVCSDMEMAAIDDGLRRALGLEKKRPFPRHKAKNEPDYSKEARDLTRDAVNHPSYYNAGKIEAIDYIADQGLDFATGSAVKYITRAGRKDPAKEVEDLEKAVWYLQDKIRRLRSAE